MEPVWHQHHDVSALVHSVHHLDDGVNLNVLNEARERDQRRCALHSPIRVATLERRFRSRLGYIQEFACIVRSHFQAGSGSLFRLRQSPRVVVDASLYLGDHLLNTRYRHEEH